MKRGKAEAIDPTTEGTEHPGDAEAYALFTEHTGWVATWAQLGPVARAAFSATFGLVRTQAVKGQTEPESVQRDVRAAKKRTGRAGQKC